MLATPESTQLDKFDQAFNRLASERLSPGILARLIARIRWSSLDKKLVNSADAASSPSLAARSAALTSRRERAALAEGLFKLIDSAHGRQRRWWAVGRHDAVRANAQALIETAELLRSRGPLHARGIAMLNLLLTDGCGPCYCGDAARLASTLQNVRKALAE
jgi:hypothetical protein